MKRARNTSEEKILLVSPEPEKLMPVFHNIVKTNPEISFVTTESGVEGLNLYKLNRPCLAIISDKLEDMRGSSISTLLMENVNQEADAAIWLIDVDKIIYNTKADLLFPSDMDMARFEETLKKFLTARSLNRLQYSDLNLARENQLDKVPEKMSNEFFDLNIIYSPFSQTGLSGDGGSYSFDRENKILSGFIFDVEGHDLMAYYNTNTVDSHIQNAIRYNLKTSMDFTMGNVFEQVNVMYCDLMGRDFKTTAALIFKIDFNKKKMYYCSAGINFFLVRRKSADAFEKIFMQNPLFGAEDSSKYKDYELDLTDIETIYVSSDGFYSLLVPEGKNRDFIRTAKKDDMTLMMINLKQ